MSKSRSTNRLSKSRFVAGHQCHKLLWWKVHERDAPELQPNEVLQDRFSSATTRRMATGHTATLGIWQKARTILVPNSRGICWRLRPERRRRLRGLVGR